MIKLRWPDGEFTQGETWGEILDALRLAQWRRLGRLGFRVEMARRARSWGGKGVPTLITLFGSAAAFGRALAVTGLYSIAREDGRPDPHRKEIP